MSSGALSPFLGGGHPGRPLGTRDYPAGILHQVGSDPSVPRGQMYFRPSRGAVGDIQRGGGSVVEGCHNKGKVKVRVIVYIQ